LLDGHPCQYTFYCPWGAPFRRSLADKFSLFQEGRPFYNALTGRCTLHACTNACRIHANRPDDLSAYPGLQLIGRAREVILGIVSTGDDLDGFTVPPDLCFADDIRADEYSEGQFQPGFGNTHCRRIALDVTRLRWQLWGMILPDLEKLVTDPRWVAPAGDTIL
jgi:hypothetical protein